MTRIDMILTMVPTAAYKTLVLFERHEGNHRGQSQQSRVELGLCRGNRLRRANDLELLMHTAAMESVSLCERMKR